jgi:hypothetical protein
MHSGDTPEGLVWPRGHYNELRKKRIALTRDHSVHSEFVVVSALKADAADGV